MSFVEHLYSFKSENRITKKTDFLTVYKEGTRKTFGPLLIHTRTNSKGVNRLGLSVSRKTGNAVFRNKVKRRCREAFRTVLKNSNKSIDIIVTVRPHSPALSTEEFSTILLQVVSQ